MTKSTVKRAFKYRFYPTDAQAGQLSRTFGCVRLVYNRALAERTTAWFTEQRRINYNQASAALTEWKKDPDLAFLNEVSSVPLQQGLRHLQTAFRNFFDKCARYPRFKSRKKSKASAEYSRSGFKYRNGQLTLAKMSAPLDIVWSRPLPEGAVPSTVTVSRDSAGRWHVSILCQDTITHHAPTDRVVGVDAGITSLVSLSTGQKVANPKHERIEHRASGSPGPCADRLRATVQTTAPQMRRADMPDDVVEYLNAVLERERRIRTAEESRVREYEAAGHRIVDGGQTGRDTWQVTDWRTDAVLAQGSDGIKGYLAVTESEQARGWMHVDRITADLGEDDTALPEKLPLSLCEVLEQWVTAQHTADTEVATLLGWPVEQVAEARRGR